MTSKRKADIQRKLTLTAVPRPPDDLLDRIKGDIPNYLNVEAERARFSRSVGFNLRIAASIIVLVSIASLLFVIDNRSGLMQPVSVATRAKSAAKADRNVVTTTAAPAEEVRVEIVQQAAPASVAAPPPARIAEARPLMIPDERFAGNEVGTRRRDADQEQVSGRVEGGVEGGVAGGVVGGVAGGVMSGVMSDRSADSAPVVVAEAPAPVPPLAEAEFAPVPPPSPMAAPMPTPMPARTAAAAKTSSTSSVIAQAYADDLRLSPKSVFGISVDPAVFRRIKATIESGSRPSPSSVNVEALVNYFAGAPSRRVRRGVHLETEASPAPVDANGHRGILRFTIDTASIDVPERGSVPPIATDARLEIDFNRDAVERFEAIGDSATMTPESALLHNLSVTGLYALDLRTPLKATQRVATVRLHYRSIADGKKRTIVREVHGSDFSQQWANASRRHRLASLGALWGESLRGSSGGTDVARRAEELASQAPNDERARELAEVAVASSGGER
jgi:hypothetical protein